MKPFRARLALVFAGTALFVAMSTAAPGRAEPPAPLTLWYAQPARDWQKEALPIGNGRLAAMLFGTVPREHIQFNEESLWIGDQKPGDKGVRKVSWPSEMLGGKEVQAGRYTFATHNHFKASSPLQPAGLRGPVSLMREE
jgi:hypothetical protein